MVPLWINVKSLAKYLLFGKAAEKFLEKFCPDLAEESPHDHIEFMQKCLLFPAGKDAFDYYYYQKYLQGKECQVAEHVDKDVMDIPEDKVVNVVQQCGGCHKGKGNENKC